MLTGTKLDVKAITIYKFWEKIYYAHVNPEFPYDSIEALGRSIGVVDHVGHALTYKVFQTKTKSYSGSEYEVQKRLT